MSEQSIEINIPQDNPCIWDKVKEKYGDKEISVLEIGVYKAAQIDTAHHKCNIKAYIGVDPYSGTVSDMYKGSYWKDELESFRIYEQSNRIFDR
jgi:hypothetical protein